MSVTSAVGPVVVGVYPGQSAAVVAEAALLAAELDRPLLCGYVTLDSYLTEWEKADKRQASLHPGDLDAEDSRQPLYGEHVDPLRTPSLRYYLRESIRNRGAPVGGGTCKVLGHWRC